jgi:hypothetical protein
LTLKPPFKFPSPMSKNASKIYKRWTTVCDVQCLAIQAISSSHQAHPPPFERSWPKIYAGAMLALGNQS